MSVWLGAPGNKTKMQYFAVPSIVAWLLLVTVWANVIDAIPGMSSSTVHTGVELMIRRNLFMSRVLGFVLKFVLSYATAPILPVSESFEQPSIH